MLVLSRKCGQRIQIGDDIIITITKSSRGKVTLGIDAPSDIKVRRAELSEHATPAANGCQAVDSCVAAKNG